MNVGMVGLGKLGLPVAYAMAARGLNVYGTDPNVTGPPDDCSHEHELEETVRKGAARMRFTSLQVVVAACDVVMVAVQTPHDERFEGTTPLPDDRADFDYSYLRDAVKEIAYEASRQDRQVTIAVISTVLPGTLDREIRPLLGSRCTLVYNPSFIAMGTTIQDFLDPEFVLLGGDPGQFDPVLSVYFALGFGRKCVEMSIRDAELTKVAYNTFIGLKIAFANTLMEVCHKTGCDVDEVTGALALAHRRLISPAYMAGGMGDGGGCHPRDNIALSWLARELDLSHDLFEDVMVCREDQARWLADMMIGYTTRSDYPRGLGILGTAYKPGSGIQTGSPALLVDAFLPDDEDVYFYDPRALRGQVIPEEPRIWLVGCKHPEFVGLKLPEGSIVIDPFRYIPDQEGVEVIRLGQRPVAHNGQARTSGELRGAAA